MNHVLPTVIALLAGAAVLVPLEVSAQARGPSRLASQQASKVDSVPSPADQLAELDAWLNRLVGRFRIRGTLAQPVSDFTVRGVAGRGVQGIVDCVRIGGGSGVNCVINATWQPVYDGTGLRIAEQPLADSEYHTMRHAVIVYGIDPEALGIHFLLMDDRSIADGGLGFLKGDAVSFENYKKACGLPQTCPRSMRITSEPGSESISMEMHFPGGLRIWLQLQHMSREDGESSMEAATGMAVQPDDKLD